MNARAAKSLAPLVLAVALGACATSRAASPGTSAAEHPTLYSTLWVQTAAEYRASAWQAYAAARETLRRALVDSTWTAAVEQEGRDFSALPPAIVLDIDETVLDNSPHQARAIEAGVFFDRRLWETWVDEARARPVPGAVEFLRAADSLGVAIFYVSNRDHPQEAATRRNLEAVGLPVDPRVDTVLLRGEREEWASDKSSRRESIADRYRIVLVIGDDFNDFVPARLPRAERDRLVERHRDRWGERWIILPNPNYGSWESALYGEGELTAEDRVRLRREALEDLRP